MSSRRRQQRREREAADAKKYDADDYGFNEADVAIAASDPRQSAAQAKQAESTAKSIAKQLDPAHKGPVPFFGPLAFNLFVGTNDDGVTPDLCPFVIKSSADGGVEKYQTYATARAKPSDFKEGDPRIVQQSKDKRDELGRLMAWYCLRTDPGKSPEEQYDPAALDGDSDDEGDDWRSAALPVAALSRTIKATLSSMQEETPEGEAAAEAVKKAGIDADVDEAVKSLQGKNLDDEDKDAKILEKIKKIIRDSKRANAGLRGSKAMPKGYVGGQDADQVLQGFKAAVAGEASSPLVGRITVQIPKQVKGVTRLVPEEILVPKVLLPFLRKPSKTEGSRASRLAAQRLYEDKYSLQLVGVYNRMTAKKEKKAQKGKLGGVSAAQRLGLDAKNVRDRAHAAAEEEEEAAPAEAPAEADGGDGGDEDLLGGGDDDADDLSAILTGAMTAHARHGGSLFV